MMRRLLLTIVLMAAVAAAGLAGWAHWHKAAPAVQPAGIVPSHIRQAVDFPVYYPDQTKLPPGYTFDASSLRSPVKNGVNYSINYGVDKNIVFTLQLKPSDSELKTFYSNYIPLRTDVQTNIGLAEIGSYHNQALASLPVTGGPWIIITAPMDIDQNQLKQVLQSLKKD